jgi:metallo-beta-lactamase family protein
MSDTTLTCWGGVGSVTGANFLLEIGGKKVLIDCGFFQGVNEEANSESFPYDPASIDYLFVTHSHLDHIGKIPLLVKHGFKGTIYSTHETKEICTLMLPDAAKVGGIFSLEDVEKCFDYWKELEYHSKTDFGGFAVEVFNAGHILGSAMYKVSTQNGSILFVDDLGNPGSILLPHADAPTGIDYLLIDSVYGDRNHDDVATRDMKLAEIVRRNREKKGTLLIPAFSLERTQSVLYELNEIFNRREVEPYPVFLDSPLSIKVTRIYEKITKYYKDNIQNEVKKDDIFKFPSLQETAEVRDSREIAHVPGPKIIIAGSGMSTAGRIVGHEEAYLPDPNTTIIFIGYQAPGTLGRQIEEGNREVTIDGQQVSVRAEVVKIGDFSGHADSNQLVEFVEKNAKTLKHVFVAMGEPRSAMFLVQRLKNELGLDVSLPDRGKAYKLDI